MIIHIQYIFSLTVVQKNQATSHGNDPAKYSSIESFPLSLLS
jgi:hypothetical protein